MACRRQGFIWTNTENLHQELQGTHFSVIWIKIQSFFNKNEIENVVSVLMFKKNLKWNIKIYKLLVMSEEYFLFKICLTYKIPIMVYMFIDLHDNVWCCIAVKRQLTVKPLI